MEDLSEYETTIAWLWIIEAMASFKEVSLSLIRDLLKAAPELPCGLAKNAKERIALRCLQDLCARQSRRTSDNSSSQVLKVEFELSESCENVLQRVVQETPESDLKLGGQELVKYDFLSFIRHKEAHLPELALEKLRDSIIDGTHPYADFLKEKSGLESTSQEENGVCMNDKNQNADTSRPNLTRPDGENKRVEVSPDHPIVENNNIQLEENLQNGDLLPSKRVRSAFDDGDNKAAELESRDGIDCSNAQSMISKKAKLQVSNDNQSFERNPVLLHEKVQEEDARNVSVTTGSHDLADSDMGTIVEDKVLENGSNGCKVSKRCNDEKGITELHEKRSESPRNEPHNPPESPHICLAPDKIKGVYENRDEPSNVPSTETLHNSSSTKEPKSINENSRLFQEPNSPQEKITASEENEKAERLEAENSGGSVRDERSEFAEEKHKLISSQPTNSYNSLVADSSDQNICMRCHGPGLALVCNSNNCQVIIHEKCLGYSVIFDDKGNFYCPFCTYSLAIVEYLKAKKISSMSCRDLEAFIGKDPEKSQPRKSTARLNKKKKHGRDSRKDKNLLSKEQKDNAIEKREEDKGNRSERYVNVENGCEHQNVLVDNRQTKSSALCNKVTEESPHVGESEGPQKEVPREKSDELSGSNTDTDLGNQTKEDLGTKPRIVKYKDGDALNQLAQDFSVSSSESDDDDDDLGSNIAKYCISVRARETRGKTNAVIRETRKYVSWTAEELQKLKEGVENFSSENKIPWKKVSEFGAGVFQECRTVQEIRQKWKLLCKPRKSKKPV